MVRHESLAEALSRSARSWEIECIDCIDSTNLELSRRYGASREAPRLVLWAEEQTEGRGRLDRRWFSIPLADITASAIFPSPVPKSDIPKLSLCAGIALVDVLRDEYGIKATVRWPNDVLTDKGKLAGILSNYIAGPDAVVCGIGINVNSKPEAIELDQYGRRTTMLAELGREVERGAMLASWLLRFEKLWPLAHAGRTDELREEFDRISFYRGKRVRVRIGAGADREDDPECEEIEGTAGSIDPSGALLIELDGGKAYAVRMDDVLIPLSGPR